MNDAINYSYKVSCLGFYDNGNVLLTGGFTLGTTPMA